MIVPTDRPRQGKKCSKSNGHAEGRKPIAGVDPVSMAQGDEGKDDEQLGRDDRLHKAQTSDPESRHLKGKAEDHAGDPEEPDGAMKQVVDKVEPEAVLPRRGRRGTTLGDRGQRSKHARRQGERHHLRPHDRASHERLRQSRRPTPAVNGLHLGDNTWRM